MIGRTLILISLFAAGALMQACAKRPSAEKPCAFVQNSYGQRVSWVYQTPIVLYVHSGVPSEAVREIRMAMDQWNKVLGSVVLTYGGVVNSPAEASQDRANVIFWRTTWEDKMYFEQGRTTIHFVNKNILDADIQINAKDFVYSFSDSGTEGTVDFQSLILHELGHVLGLAHAPPEVASVMQKDLAMNNLRRTPQKTDIDSLKCEY